MELLNGHPIPETLARYDYSNLMGWQVGQCIVCENKDGLRIKGYFERKFKWQFVQRKQGEGQVKLWRKA